MSGSRAKRLRRAVYGLDLSPRFRKYGTRTTETGASQVLADPLRQTYQRLKRQWRAQ